MSARSAKPAPERGAAKPLKPQEFDKSLKSGASGAYFFYGEEDYLARAYADKLRKKVLGGDTFNHVVLDGETYSPGTLSDEIETLPMMADRRLIEVRGVDFTRAGTADELCAALEGLPGCEHAVVLVTATGEHFDAGTERQPSKALAAVASCAVLVYFAYETPSRLAQWVSRHFEAEGVAAPPPVCEELVAYSGRDMTALSGEIEKLAAYALAHGRGNVTAADIREVCASAVELDSFALANAVLRGDADGAMSALAEAKSRRERPELLLGSVSRVFCDLYAVKLFADAGMDKREISAALKIHEYKAGLYVSACRNRSAQDLARAVERCREADLKLKSTPVPGEVILTRLAIMGI